MKRNKDGSFSRKKRNRTKALIIDFELACWRYGIPRGYRTDIIEIGVCTYNFRTRKISKPESILIKSEKSDISEFCTKLTGITPEMVEEKGISLKRAIDILVDKYDSNRCIWFSWGDQDRTFIERDCRYYKLPNPFHVNYIDARDIYCMKHFTEPSVENALKELGMEFEGSPHRAGDDAYNTARILRELLWEGGEHDEGKKEKQREKEKVRKKEESSELKIEQFEKEVDGVLEKHAFVNKSLTRKERKELKEKLGIDKFIRRNEED